MTAQGQKELSRLRRRISDLKRDVDEVLRSEFDRRLYVSDEDSYRLLILREWEEKYKVSLSYILRRLLPVWWLIMGRTRKRRKGFDNGGRKGGLGVLVSTLTGDKSEQILKEKIKEDYPGGENVELSRQHRREEILAGDDDGIEVKQKGLLDSDSPADFLNSYAKSIGRKRDEREQTENDEERKLRRYRGSPW